MPIYKQPRIIVATPSVKSIYSYRSSRRDQANSLYEKNRVYTNSYKKNKNYGDQYDFPVNYPSVATMQASVGTVGTNLGTIPF